MNKCVVCGRTIKDDKVSYKIKKRVLFKDTDNSFWFSWGKVEICEDCLNVVREIVHFSNQS